MKKSSKMGTWCPQELQISLESTKSSTSRRCWNSTHFSCWETSHTPSWKNNNFRDVILRYKVSKKTPGPENLGESILGGVFKYFLFSPLFGEDSHFDSYFSNGLKPPTSGDFPSFSPTAMESWVAWNLGSLQGLDGPLHGGREERRFGGGENLRKILPPQNGPGFQKLRRKWSVVKHLEKDGDFLLVVMFFCFCGKGMMKSGENGRTW